MKRTNLILIVLLAMCTVSFAQDKEKGKSTPAIQGQTTNEHPSTARPALNNKRGGANGVKRPGVPAGIATPQGTKNSTVAPNSSVAPKETKRANK